MHWNFKGRLNNYIMPSGRSRRISKVCNMPSSRTERKIEVYKRKSRIYKMLSSRSRRRIEVYD